MEGEDEDDVPRIRHRLDSFGGVHCGTLDLSEIAKQQPR